MVPNKLFILFLFTSTTFTIVFGHNNTNLFSYGKYTENTLNRGDDGYNLVNLQAPAFPFFNESYTRLFVNINGGVSFRKGVGDYTPNCSALPKELAMIAPYWSDVDTRDSDSDKDGWGRIYYRQETNNYELGKAVDLIRKAYPSEWGLKLSWLFIVSWENVTNYVSNYDNCSRSLGGFHPRNTFQLVLATNGLRSWSIFLYKHLEWTTGTESGGNCSGLGGSPARAGFDSGDGITFYKTSYSCTDNILRLQDESNIGEEGVWVFKTDNYFHDVSNKCQNEVAEDIKITPTFTVAGSFIKIQGPCIEKEGEVGNLTLLNPKTNLTLFEGNATFVDVNSSQIFLLLPEDLPTIGRIVVHLNFTESGRNSTIYQGQIFTTEEIPFRATVAISDPIVNEDLHFEVKWERSPEFAHVSVIWYFYNDKTDQTYFANETRRVIPNTGSFKGTLAKGVIPENFVVGDAGVFISPVQAGRRRRRVVGLLLTLARLGGSQITAGFRILQGVALYGSLQKAREIVSRAVCAPNYLERWLHGEEEAKRRAERRFKDFHDTDPGTPSVGSGIEACPPKRNLASSDDRFSRDWMADYLMDCNYFHPGCDASYRQKHPSESGARSQCVYDRQGGLITTGRGRGTVDSASGLKHWKKDVRPYCDGCKFSNNCDKYNEKRPTTPSDGYNHTRTAKSVGDPHLTTFDGVEYMFNGKGEYWMVYSEAENGFKMQARFEQMGRASISTAFVMSGSNYTVQVYRSSNVADVLLDGVVIPFPTNQERVVTGNGVEIRKLSNGEVRASFKDGFAFRFSRSGPSLNIIASASGRGYLGLLGMTDGNPENDLTARNGTILSRNSTNKQIHYGFGITWIVKEEETMFLYADGTNYTTFYDPEFTPFFELPTNSHINLSERVITVCGNSTNCIFDYVATQDLELAKGTKELDEMYRNFSAPISSYWKQIEERVEVSRETTEVTTEFTPAPAPIEHTTESFTTLIPVTVTETPTANAMKINASFIAIKLQITLSNLPQHDEGLLPEWLWPDPYLKLFIKGHRNLYWKKGSLVTGNVEPSYKFVERTARYRDKREVTFDLNRPIPFFDDEIENGEIQQILNIEVWDEDIQMDDKMYDIDIPLTPFLQKGIDEDRMTKVDPAVYVSDWCCGGAVITVRAYEVKHDFPYGFP